MGTPRTRSRYNIGPITHVGEAAKIPQPNGPRKVVHSAEVVVRSEEETISDEITESFHRKSNNGDVIVSPVSHVKTSITTTGNGGVKFVRSGSGDIYEYTCDNFTGYARTIWPVHSAPVAPSPSYDMNAAARLQALGNVDRSPYGFAEDIAELHETLRFLRDPLKSIRDITELFRKTWRNPVTRRKGEKIEEISDAISNAWLQYQFALSPLVRSVNDAVEAAMTKVRRPDRRTARGGSEWTSSDSVEGWLNNYYRSAATVNETVVVKAGILYEVSNPLKDWKFKYGLRFKNIPETLWAIFPLSFMVDRMFNLTQTIRGINAFLDPNVTMLGAWTSSKLSKVETVSFLEYDSPIVQSVLRMDPDVETVKTDSYTRDPWVPSISDLVPEVRTDRIVDTSTKIADLAALCWQNLRRL